MIRSAAPVSIYAPVDDKTFVKNIAKKDARGADSQKTEVKSSRVRIRGLDGLRALAVLFVLGYHFFTGYFPAGFLGVDVFFVLSGFLITVLLIREWEKTRKIDVKAFWFRRYRRLVPAVILATLGSFFMAALISRDAIVQARWQIFGSITGTYNWFELVHHSSYFDEESPFLLKNMWSLAVEQQFYLIWPFIVILLLLIPYRWLRVGLSLGFAGASFIWSLHLLSISDGDVTRAYVGTDSHFYGLALGAALAFAVPHALDGISTSLNQRQRRRYVQLHSRHAIVGILAVLFLILAVVFLPDGLYLFSWATLGACVLTAIVIRAMLPDMAGQLFTQLLWRIFDAPLMRWIGERSYGIYLWHWPLFVIFRYGTNFTAWQMAIFVSALSINLAHLSYTYIENPIRRQGFLSFIKERTHKYGKLFMGFTAALLAAGCVLVIVLSPARTTMQAIIENGEKQAAETRQNTSGTSPTTEEADDEAQSSQVLDGSDKAPSLEDGANVIYVGDSLGTGAAPPLQELLPKVYNDVKAYRQWPEGHSILQSLSASGTMRPYVVVSLGSNGGASIEDLDAALEEIGPDGRLVLVTLYAPDETMPRYQYMRNVTALYYDFADKHPDRVRIAAWDKVQPGMAYGSIHPGPDGYKVYAQEIVRALESF